MCFCLWILSSLNVLALGVTSVRDIHRLLQGCVDPQNPATCVANITYWHVSLGLWGTKGWDTIQPGGMVPENLGSMGYRRFEGIFVKENLWDASIPPMVSLENTFWIFQSKQSLGGFLDNILLSGHFFAGKVQCELWTSRTPS